MNISTKKNRRIRNCIFLLFCLFAVNIPSLRAESGSGIATLLQITKEKTITLKKDQVKLNVILEEIRTQTGIGFGFDIGISPEKEGLFSLSVTRVTVADALDKLFSGSTLQYRVSGDKIIIGRRPQATTPTASKKTVEGRVNDSQGNPLAGVAVTVKGSTTGTSSDGDGKFSLPVKSGDMLVFSYVGMQRTEIVYTGESPLTVTLKEAVEAVDEVVVTGYFTRNKNSYTGNATSFKGEELRQISSGNIMNTLSMIDPSFKMVVNNEIGSDPNQIPDFQIQGSTNLQNEYSNTPNMPTFILDGFEVSAQKVFDLDPNRVKGITILKDAAATAIYGSRAANGVVIVETIAPKEGELRVSYSFNGDFSVADLSSYNLMNAAEKLEYEKAAGLYKHSYAPEKERLDNLYNSRLELVKKGIDTDWIKKPVRSVGFSHKHSLIVDGGGETLRYSIDLNYRGENGVMKGSDRKNYGIGVKLQYNYKKLRFMNDLTVANTRSNNSPYGAFSEYSKMNPYYYPYDNNGNVLYQLHKATGSSDKNVYNPLWNATINTVDKTSISDVAERFSLEWNALEGLKLKAQASIERQRQTDDVFKPNNHTSFAEVTENKGSYKKTETQTDSYDFNLTASYFKMMGKHSLNAVAVYELRENKDNYYSFTAYNFPNDRFDHISMATQFKEGDRPTGNDYISRLMGVVVNANYSYDNRFLADVSLRSDASSVFGSNKRWGTFYSVGGGWNLHNEQIFDNAHWMNLLKLRVSYGTTGGQNFNPYQAMMMYSYKDTELSDLTYGDRLGALLMAYGNKDLKWQVTRKLNVGVDFAWLDNRISGYVNWYRNVTVDKLIDFTLAPSTGFSLYTENLGNVNNTGWEVNLKGTLWRVPAKNIRWDVFVNLVTNKNELRNINNALTAFNNKQNSYINDNKDKEISNKPVVKYMEGESINTIWANRSLGIDPTTGKEIFIDRYGNRVDTYDVLNDMPIAVTDPDFEGNFGTTFMYRGFTLNAYFGYSIGGYVYNTTLVNKIENVNPLYNGDKRILYDRWKNAGDVAKYKNIANTEITHPTSRFIEKDNYLKLTSLSISYQFEPSFLKPYGIQMLKIGAIGNDLFRSSTVKMERGISYPFARTFTINCQLTF